MTCKNCSSHAINHHAHGRDGTDGDLCDVCYWRKRAQWPQNAQDVRDMMHGNCEVETWAIEGGKPDDDDRYQLTAHDFLTAIDEWRNQ